MLGFSVLQGNIDPGVSLNLNNFCHLLTRCFQRHLIFSGKNKGPSSSETTANPILSKSFRRPIPQIPGNAMDSSIFLSFELPYLPPLAVLYSYFYVFFRFLFQVVVYRSPKRRILSNEKFVTKISLMVVRIKDCCFTDVKKIRGRGQGIFCKLL